MRIGIEKVEPQAGSEKHKGTASRVEPVFVDCGEHGEVFMGLIISVGSGR